jgi:hypothetical protein
LHASFSSRSERDQRWLVALANDAQGAVAVGEREVAQVCATGFGDPQGVAGEQARQDVVVAA